MKTTIMFAVALFFAAQLSAQTKDFTGTWQGKINAGTEVTIIFHFTKNSDGSYTGTMDSPTQGAIGIQLSTVTVHGDSLIAELKAAGVVYSSSLAAGTVLAGTWAQHGSSLPLTVTRTVQQIAEDIKPQTPVPPFAYNSDSVEYDNADRSVHFGATFTYPKTGGTFPTAILITGSGQQDRDETVMGHKPFAVLADYLTKKGYAVLRIDDRGVGKTTGSLTNVTSADFANDIEAGLAYAKTRAEVNKNKIGLIGHSEGGAIAPMVAAQHPEINFIILWAGPIAGGLKINVEQNGYGLQKAGIGTAAVNAFKQLHAQELGLFATSTNVSALNTSVKQVFDAWKKQQPDSVLKSLYTGDTVIVGKSIYAIYDGLYNLAWMRFFIIHDFAADLARVHCNVLALNGSLDMQVDAKMNLAIIDSVLKKNNNHSYATVTLPGLNHLFQTAVTGDVSEYATTRETIAPGALKVIGGWLDANVLHK